MDKSGTRPRLERLLREAGGVALSYFSKVGTEYKADGTVVSEADRACEAVLVEGLSREFPGCGIVGEEGASVGGDGMWYVDPIDGTGSFLAQLADWGPTVCLLRDGALVAGAYYNPRLDEFWYAAVGEGAWRDDRRLKMEDPGEPGRSDIIFLPSGFHRAGALEFPGKMRSLGSSAAHLAAVAGGGGVAALIPVWHLWDVGAGVLLIEEAGGAVIVPDGERFDPVRHQGLPLLAGAPTALRSLLRDGKVRRRGPSPGP
jgi:myo-inositol-1(or 4)-monophosphatase